MTFEEDALNWAKDQTDDDLLKAYIERKIQLHGITRQIATHHEAIATAYTQMAHGLLAAQRMNVQWIMSHESTAAEYLVIARRNFQTVLFAHEVINRTSDWNNDRDKKWHRDQQAKRRRDFLDGLESE